MAETAPTAATMRLDGGHPALELVNTVYAQVGGPVEVDVLAAPADLVTFARRVGAAGDSTRTGRAALRAALEVREAVDALLRAHLAGGDVDTVATATGTGRSVTVARAALEAAARAAQDAARLARAPLPDGAYTWTWDDADPLAPVHRLTHAASRLLADPAELARLHCCDACCWLFLDHSRGGGRRWCSMADCGTEAKKRRYVERRRERRRPSR